LPKSSGTSSRTECAPGESGSAVIDSRPSQPAMKRRRVQAKIDSMAQALIKMASI
jgi:hypothetical protein